MRRKLTLILSFIALSIVSNAQGAYGKTKEIEEFYKRKVIIVKEEYDKDVIKKLEKKGEKGDVTLYKHTIDQYNANFKKAVQAMWPKQTTFSIKTLDQTLDLKKDKKKYAVVYIGRIARSENGSGYHQVEGIEFDASAIFNDKLDTSNRYSSGLHNSYIFFNLIEDIYKFPIILAGMNCSFPSVADFACAVQYATWYMQGRLTDKNMSVTIDEVPDEYVKLLTEKTLYIRESDINEKCTAEDIAGMYKYKYTLVSDVEFDTAVMTKKDDVLYLAKMLFPANASLPQALTLVMEAATGKPCAIVSGDLLSRKYLETKRVLSKHAFTEINKTIDKSMESK